MAGGDAAATAGDVAAKKLRKEEEEDDDEMDKLPLAVSRGKKVSNPSASKVKEEEEDDEFDNMPISHSRAKKGNEKLKGAMGSAKASKVKKEESDSDDEFELTVQKKSGGASVSARRTSKVKKIKDEDLDDVKKTKKRVTVKDRKAGTGKADKEKVKKERKVYDLPGQKHDPPEERDPLRIFYESLYEQIPTSDMAATWLMEWGLLPLDVARKVFEKKQGPKLKSPVKIVSAKRVPASPIKKTTPSSAKKTGSTANAGKMTSQKKRKASSDSDDDDDDFMVPKAQTKRQKGSS